MKKNLIIIMTLVFIAVSFTGCKGKKGVCVECGKEKTVYTETFFEGTEAVVTVKMCRKCLKKARIEESRIMQKHLEADSSK